MRCKNTIFIGLQIIHQSKFIFFLLKNINPEILSITNNTLFLHAFN